MKKIKSTENFYKKYIETSFPAAIYDDTTLPEFMVMTVLYSHHDDGEKYVTVSRRTIAECCNMSVCNVERILKSLAEKDLIRVQHNYSKSGRQTENSYKLIYRDYQFCESNLHDKLCAV